MLQKFLKNSSLFKKRFGGNKQSISLRGAKIRICACKKTALTWDHLVPPLLAGLFFSGLSSDQFILKFVWAVAKNFVSNI